MGINAEPARSSAGIVETVLHPGRLRIVHALMHRELTARQLSAELSDIPQASLYRHVGRLVDAGVLRVTREERVRGGTQRTYTVVESAVTLGPHDFDAATPSDHQRYFAAFVGALVAGFEQYLRATDAAPTRDGVVYQQIPLWTTPAESRQLAAAITDLVRPLRTRSEGQRRRRTTFAMVLHPDPAT
ncbi:helix-turn-helix domain-containing protein [Micromonospora sp. NPDC000442]|uniref:helix-turn-helix domain-containing protein n=1 Tax=Micromonospora sp. NPDC000442 TaxID=3364217 RepID=UPI0036C4262B